MNDERDKFLTEAMGECWHDWDDVEIDAFLNRSEWICTKCKQTCGGSSTSRYSEDYDNDFSTWEGFGKLWEWAQKQDWWKTFKQSNVIDLYGIPECRIIIPDVLINPDKFANTVYNYLNGVTTMTLYINDEPAYIGEKYTTFRGEYVTLLHMTEPHKPSSSGRVYIQYENGATGECFPNVIGGVWR